jgi:hypothetical protein
MNPIPEHLLPVTEGVWRKFDQHSDSHELVATIRGKGTGWCTAGENTAHHQLEGGDFYIFYSQDYNQQPTIPRIAIRMDEGKIAEVRGVAHKQNLDPYMGEVLEKKLEEFPDKEEYLKKEKDMKQLTDIDTKTKKGEKLTKDELAFLYEIDAPITYFGYEKDPRIKELRDARDTDADLPIIFDCAPKDIAHSVSEIGEHTKAYIGKLEPGVFDALQKGVEHIYTKFPEERIKFHNDVELGTGIKNGPAFQKIITERNIQISRYANDLLKSPDFAVIGEYRNVDLIEMSVRALGFENWAQYKDICKKAIELGLELCPAEVGPQLRLQYTDQPMSEWLIVAMNAISASDGGPVVFAVIRSGGGLWLYTLDGGPAYEWDPGRRFVFLRPRK